MPNKVTQIKKLIKENRETKKRIEKKEMEISLLEREFRLKHEKLKDELKALKESTLTSADIANQVGCALMYVYKTTSYY